MKKTLTLAFCACTIAVNAQTMTTFCGNGISASTGDGGPATSAAINGPSGIVFDAAGNTYVTEYSSSKIRKINSAGIITTFAGTGTAGFSGDGGAATSAKINHPIKLLIDAAGNIYVADYGNCRIRMITPAGIISTFAGTGTPASTGDGGPATSAAIFGPIGMDFDASGNMYVSDYNSYKIRKITPGGTITTIAGTGTAGFSGDGGLATAAKIHNVWGVKVDAAGNIYLADASNHRVRKISTSGIITTIAGTGTPGFSGDGGLAIAAQLNNPSDIEIDASGNIFIADQVNNRIRMITPAGIITTVVGNGIATYAGDGGSPLSASINNSNDIALSPAGELYMCDDNNYRVRKVSDILSATSICVGAMSTLSDTTGGGTGTWSSGNTAIATIGSSSGVVTGVAAGTAVISYVTSSSTHTAVVTVLPLPNAGTITGTAVVCSSATTTLSDPTGMEEVFGLHLRQQ